MAEKKRKSKAEQRKDMAKLAAVAAAGGYAAGKLAKRGRRGKKGRKIGAVVGVLAALIIVAVGAMYYYDVKPFDADWFNGQFKSWYMSADSFVQSDGNLQIRFLDIGQGDCALIQLPDGKNMLIDGGKNNGETEEKIIKTLTDLGIDTIDYGVLTHTDSDHVGGMDAVIASDEITFKAMYMPLVKSKSPGDKVEEWFEEAKGTYLKDLEAVPADFEIPMIRTDRYADFMEAVLAEEGCQPYFSLEGMTIGGEEAGYIFDFYNPTYKEYQSLVGEEEKQTAKEKNNVSPVMILRFNDKKIMFTGDCDDAESNFIETAVKGNVADYDVDVLKVAHHGGKQSTSEDFLKIVKPEFSVISVGNNNYGHPTDEVIDRLNAVGSKIFTTQDKGDIILTMSGDRMGWSFAKDGSSYGDASEYDGEDAPSAAVSAIIPTYNAKNLTGRAA